MSMETKETRAAKEMKATMKRLCKAIAQEYTAPAAQFSKAVNAFAKLTQPIPVDNSLRGRWRRKWRRITSFKRSWVVTAIAIILLILGACLLNYVILWKL